MLIMNIYRHCLQIINKYRVDVSMRGGPKQSVDFNLKLKDWFGRPSRPLGSENPMIIDIPSAMLK